MYPGWLPLLGGQSVPEGSRNPVVCVLYYFIEVYMCYILEYTWIVL